MVLGVLCSKCGGSAAALDGGGVDCERCGLILTEQTKILPTESLGVKYDDGKLLWSLLPIKPVEEIIKVLMLGAKKYAPDNWMRVPVARIRYYNAAMRHLTTWGSGEAKDPESALSHLAHAGCCILFLLWFELKEAPHE